MINDKNSRTFCVYCMIHDKNKDFKRTTPRVIVKILELPNDRFQDLSEN